MTDEPYIRKGLAIINRYGGVWTDQLFRTPEEAQAYLRQFWKNVDTDLRGFKLAEASLTIQIDRPVGDPTYIPFPS